MRPGTGAGGAWLLAAALLLGACRSPTHRARPLQVFVLAGQSNMEGQGVVDLDGPDYNDGRGTLVKLLQDPGKAALFAGLRDERGAWRVRDDVWVWYQPEEGELKSGPLTLGFTPYEGRHHFGPELGIGHVLGDALPEQVLLIKTAWGGKSLFQDFRPPSSGGELGPYYAKMRDQVRDVLANLHSYFPQYDGGGFELAGLVWFQGWNDMCEPRALPEYETNLVHLVQDLRRDWNAPGLPVVIGELGNGGREASPEMAAIRAAQAAAAARPEFRGTVLFVETHDLQRPAEESPCPEHFHHEFANAETYWLTGRALGEGMLRLLAQRGH
jgi:hypothetical protein